MQCVTCHNPHKRAQFSIKMDCTTCHSKQADDFKGSAMESVGITCKDCHMARATKSATAKSKTEGDVRTHLFKINTDAKASMFYDEEVNGKKATFAKPFITLDFACLNCHKNKDMKWAAKKAKGNTQIRKEEVIRFKDVIPTKEGQALPAPFFYHCD